MPHPFPGPDVDGCQIADEFSAAAYGREPVLDSRPKRTGKTVHRGTIAALMPTGGR